MRKDTLETFKIERKDPLEWKDSLDAVNFDEFQSYPSKKTELRDEKREKIEKNIIQIKSLADSLAYDGLENQLQTLNTLCTLSYKTIRLINNFEKQRAKDMVAEILKQGYSFDRITINGFDFHITAAKEIKDGNIPS